jgi:hypothetical protein
MNSFPLQGRIPVTMTTWDYLGLSGTVVTILLTYRLVEGRSKAEQSKLVRHTVRMQLNVD